MALKKYKNAAKVQVSQGYGSTETSIQLASGEGSKLPAGGGYWLHWWKASEFADPADDDNREWVLVTDRTGDVLEVVRGQQETSAKTHNVAAATYFMVLSWSAGDISLVEDAIQDGSLSFGEDVGSADAYVVELDPTLLAYVDGMVVRWRAGDANTGASTLEIDGLGAVDLVDENGDPLAAGAIRAGAIVTTVYDQDADQFQVVGSARVLTTKGDIQTYDTAPARLPVGSNGRILVADSAQAKGMLWADGAAPLFNFILNGRFEFWPEGTSFPAIANGAYSADQWAYYKVGSGVDTVSRSTSVPWDQDPVLAAIFGRYSLRAEVTTADTSIAAGDYYLLNQPIEGWNWAQLAQRPAKLRFWARGAVPGVHCVALCNSGSDRSLVLEYTIAAADTWEYFALDVPASPSAGTWDYASGLGVHVHFARAAGSTFQTTPGTWNTGQFFATAAQVNEMATVGNGFHIADVELVEGSVAPSFIRRPYQIEKKLLERYFEKTYNDDVAPGTADTGSNSGVIECRDSSGANGAHELRLTWQFRTTKRIPPTVTWYAGDGTAVRADMQAGKQVATTLDVNQNIASVAAANGATTDHFMRVRGKASARF